MQLRAGPLLVARPLARLKAVVQAEARAHTLEMAEPLVVAVVVPVAHRALASTGPLRQAAHTAMAAMVMQALVERAAQLPLKQERRAPNLAVA